MHVKKMEHILFQKSKIKIMLVVFSAFFAIVVIVFSALQFYQYNDELVRVFYAKPNAVIDQIAVFQGKDDRPIRTLLERQNFDQQTAGLISSINEMDYQISGEHKRHELRDFTYYVYKKDSKWVLFNPTKGHCAVLSAEDTAALQMILSPEDLDKRTIG